MVSAIDGLDDARGALVTDVPAGPAEESGMLSGDVILIFDGVEIADTRELVRIVGNSPVGKEVPVQVLRDGEMAQLTVVLGRRETSEAVAFPAAAPEAPAAEPDTLLGLTLETVSPELVEQFSLNVDQGLVITAIAPDSDAASKGLIEGDVITEASRQPVGTMDELRAQIDLATEAGRTSILMLVRRGGDPRFVALVLDQE
jgi:serine protease Do